MYREGTEGFSLHCSQTLCVGTYTATKIYLFSQIFEDLYGHGQCWRHFNSQPSTDSRGVRKPYVHGLFSVMLFASLRFLLALFKMSPGTVVEEDEGRTRSKQVLPDTAGSSGHSRPTVLLNSPLWFPAQDLVKIKTLSMLAWTGEGLMSLHSLLTGY